MAHILFHGVKQEAIKLYAFVRKELKNHNDIPFKTKAQIEDSIHSVSSNIACPVK